MKPVIEIKNLGKSYKIVHENRGNYLALRDVLADIIRRPFRYFKTRAKNTLGIGREEFWALRDVSFTVQQGEVVGIIGANGAGKSTLLKILSQITPPTQGEAIIRGHLGSLLEVGTGFHPELTGRENVFLSGAILGMARKEIIQKFPAIVEFSGVEKFLDTPVKYYSSGMYVRLAFAVAAHMEPDILLVDEVLAVGDAEFQKKCLAKMEEVTRKEGRTILFVSHNMEAVRQLCDRVVLLEHGKVAAVGPANEIVSRYLGSSLTAASVHPTKQTKEIRINSITPKNSGTESPWIFAYGRDITLDIEFETFLELRDFQMGVTFNSAGNERIVSVHTPAQDLSPGKHTLTMVVPNIFTPGSYNLDLNILTMFYIPTFAVMHVAPDETVAGHKHYNQGLIDLPAQFNLH